MIIASVALMSVVVVLAIAICYGLKNEASAEDLLLTIGSLTIAYMIVMVVLLWRLIG